MYHSSYKLVNYLQVRSVAVLKTARNFASDQFSIDLARPSSNWVLISAILSSVKG